VRLPDYRLAMYSCSMAAVLDDDDIDDVDDIGGRQPSFQHSTTVR